MAAKSKQTVPDTASLFLFEPEEVKRELKKPVEAIHISGKVGLLQRKIINNLVFYALNELDSKESHQVSITELASDVGFDSNNTQLLKSSLLDLLEIIIEFNILKRGGGNQWTASPILSEVSIDGGILTYSFPPTLRRQLKNPKVFTIINLLILKRFNSAYACSLYENCLRFKQTGSTGYIDIDTWKMLLGVEADSQTYAQYKYLNSQVIQPAVKEVNRLTDIEVMPEVHKLGRNVDAIRFLIKEKDPAQVSTDFHLEDQLKVELLHRMLAFGITDKTARFYCKEHPLEYIKGNIEEVERRIAAGKEYDSIPAIFKDALEKDYRRVIPPILKEKVAKNLARQKELEENERKVKEAEDEAALQFKQRITDAKQYFESLSQTKKNDAEKLFADHLYKHNKYVYPIYCKSQLSTQTALKAFNLWLASAVDTNII